MSVPLSLNSWGVPFVVDDQSDFSDCFDALLNDPTTTLDSGEKAEQIKVLDLRGLSLASLPRGIERFTNLEELYLSNNGLTALPKTIGLLPKLRVLSLGNNDIAELPESCIELWDSLAYLFLGNNRISSLPFVEDDMSYLRVGSIGNNPLTEPLGTVCWMPRADALEMPERLSYLVSNPWSASHSKSHSKFFLERAVSLATQMNEPMIYESFFDAMRIDTQGTIHWNERFSSINAQQRAQIRQLGLSLLPVATRGATIDPSLWPQNVEVLDLSEMSMIWDWGVSQLPMLKSLKLHPNVSPPEGWVETTSNIYRPKSNSIS